MNQKYIYKIKSSFHKVTTKKELQIMLEITYWYTTKKEECQQKKLNFQNILLQSSIRTVK